MKRVLFLVVVLAFSTGSYAQFQGKVYLKDGTVKEGTIEINSGRSRIGINGIGIGIKGKKYQKEITVKAKGEKKEKISIDKIDRVETSPPAKASGKETKTETYRPTSIGDEEMLARELIPNKLYSIMKVDAVSTFSAGTPGGPTTPMDNYEHRVYYVKKGTKYEKTTLAQLKQDYKCNMDGKGNREEKIVRCLK